MVIVMDADLAVGGSMSLLPVARSVSHSLLLVELQI